MNIHLPESVLIGMVSEREFATTVVQRLREAGFEAYWAGGCVRDELLGFTPDDYDVATAAHPEQVVELFKRTIQVGVSFGVVEVLGPNKTKVQVATFRTDGNYSDGRRPDSVVYGSAEEDALRRDFTINGMFFDPVKNEVLDFVGGRQDLEVKVLRAIGNPRQRFQEDKLRLLRGIRMSSRFGFPIEAATAEAIREMAPQIGIVSAERIGEECRKILTHPSRAQALRDMEALHLLREIFPEVRLQEIRLRTLEILEGSQWPEPERVSFPLALASFIQDYSLPQVREMAERLRLSNMEESRILWLVERRRSLLEAPSLKPSKLYPILVHAGIGELLALHRTNALASNESLDAIRFCEEILRSKTRAELAPLPLITGDDLIALGWKQGPHFKQVLTAVREGQLDGVLQSTDEALKWIQPFRSG
jgi:tRNA nucleotidyltransferase/poly(A) polymerase